MVNLIMFFLLLQQPIEIKGQATVSKIDWQDNKIIGQKEYEHLTNFTISETDSILTISVDNHKIGEIIKSDSIVMYKVLNITDKEYVYDYKSTLTQKNIKWRSHGLETWFQYKLIKKESDNEFELGG